MSSTYESAITFLYSLEKFGISFGLHKISALLEPFDNPQDKLKVIHIAGSNGKGSTGAVIESLLKHHGFRAGLYTSPHLVKFNERIRINGEYISDNDIVEYVNKLKPFYYEINVKDPVTFFDFTTALAYLYFFDKKVDFAIMETGLGGRLDSTNVIKKSFVSVITNISKEHEEFLGSCLTDIAEEKAGIIKENGILVTGETDYSVLNVFNKRCSEKGSELKILKNDVNIQKISREYFNYISKKNEFKNLKCSLIGEHQIINSSLAIFALESAGIELDQKKVGQALLNVKWEGRLEKVMANPDFFIDGAHNPAGAKVLREALFNLKKRKLILIMSVMKDKDIYSILNYLAGISDVIIFTCAKIERAASAEYLEEIGKGFNKEILISEDIPSAIKKSVEISEENDIICFSGSLYAVGEAKEFFGTEKGIFSMGNNYKQTV